MENKNPFFDKISTYIGKNVNVIFKSGRPPLQGKLISVNFATMNFILESPESDYIIRDDVSSIEIKRVK